MIGDITSEWAGHSPRIAELLTSEEGPRPAQELATALGDAVSTVEDMVDKRLSEGSGQELSQGRITLAVFHQLLEDAAGPILRVENAAEAPLLRAKTDIADLASLQELLDSGARLVALEEEDAIAAEALKTDFGDRYTGPNTDWNSVQTDLEWTEEFMRMVMLVTSAEQLLAQAEGPAGPSTYGEMADLVTTALRRHREQTGRLAEKYDLDGGPWETFERAAFDHIARWTRELLDDADSAGECLQYTAAAAELDRAIGPSTVAQIREQTGDSELLPRIVERRILGAWLDWIYQEEPLLAGFASLEQEDRLYKFRELDEQLSTAARNEVRRRVFKSYPTGLATSARASEVGVLRGELSKRRRQLPIRRLFRTIPYVIQKLKPCFLVSPLAVSQYLPLSGSTSETLTFDVVIFDEASQVFPEDSVPAILRGQQLVLAGDQKQLPPSNFWRHAFTEDEEDYDDESDDAAVDQLAGRESILDAAVGMTGSVFDEAHLNVHYRSKHEALIRFSNHYFYDDRLLTFPSPGITDPWLGVRGVYVADGRYDAGASRTNRAEAEAVGDLVFDHMRTRPLGESLGVVALSRHQADLIDRLIEERRIIESDVEERFTDRVEEPFFVKNLENVQGDERDHMIISIGYGPTVESGAVPNRFGPINRQGGERRLNVVISRARQRVDVVHSLRPTDIHSRQVGARLLRRYLEYIEDPDRAFEGEVKVDPDSESESPFEEAVERALIARGHRVSRQVGVAGYRIDLAILSEDGTRFDLGIECDGWTYHSAPAARDRDWLRQSVLEGLGWKIHRVWSTAWVRNPGSELERIEAALGRARSSVGPIRNTPEDAATTTDARGSSEQNQSEGPPEGPSVEWVYAPISASLHGYNKAELLAPLEWADLLHETNEKLVQMIIEIARVEGPVHKDVVLDRIRERYTMTSLRGRTRDRLEYAVLMAQRDGKVQGDDSFIWTRNEQLSRSPRRPVDNNIEHVPPSELKTILLKIVEVGFGIPRPDLVVEAARALGFARTGGRITEFVDELVQQLLDDGPLFESFSMLRLADKQ